MGRYSKGDHAPARDSLACDLMEPIRPEVDAWVLDWVTREPLKRDWFFEQRDGNCRLMAPFAVRLSETAPMWARAVAPVAEWIARQLWQRQRKPSRETAPPTRLTQSRKREAKGITCAPATKAVAQPHSVCRTCGKSIVTGRRFCPACAIPAATEHIKHVAQAARGRAQSLESLAKHAETQRQRRKAQAAWLPSCHPKWLTEDVYRRNIQPALASLSSSTITNGLGVSRWAASRIRSGKLRPHRRHWQALAELVGVSEACCGLERG